MPEVCLIRSVYLGYGGESKPNAYITIMLTEQEKREEINRCVTRCYPKMVADFRRITTYNHIIWEDLLPFVIAEFLTKKSIDYQYKLCCIDNKLVNYIGRSMSLNIRSSTSPFWSKYRKNGYNSRGVYLAEIDINIYEWDEVVDHDQKPEDISAHECLNIAIDQLDFYHKQLIYDYYIMGLTYQQIREKYGITISSIRKDVKNGVKLIQAKCSSFVPKNLKQ
jgi:hypothetical protein